MVRPSIHLRAHERQPGRLHVEQRAEFIDIVVAVGVQGDVGGEVQGDGRDLGGKRVGTASMALSFSAVVMRSRGRDTFMGVGPLNWAVAKPNP